MRIVFLSLFLLPFFVPSISFAESSASVKVNNNANSSSTSETNVNTDIRIETNGHVTTYSSDKSEDIEIKAQNDTSEIKVNGKQVTQAPLSSPAAKPTVVPTKEKETENQDQNDIFEVIEELLEKVFSFFG